jgi:hypothetical protein
MICQPQAAATPDNTTQGQHVARGWLEVVRLAERERRKDAGEPLIELVKK